MYVCSNIGWKNSADKHHQFNAQVTQSNCDLQRTKIVFIIWVFFFVLIARLWGKYCLSTCKHVLPLDFAETFSRLWWWETFDLGYINSLLHGHFLFVWYSVVFLTSFIAISEDKMPKSVESYKWLQKMYKQVKP